MNIVCIISLFLLIGTVVVTFMQGKDILSPSRVVIVTWSFVFFLTELKLSAYQYEWSLFSWFVVLLGPVSLLLGMFVVRVVSDGTKRMSVYDVRTFIRTKCVDEHKLLFAIYIIFAAYAISYMGSFLVKGFIPGLSKNGAVLRSQFTVFGLGWFINAGPMILLFCTLYLNISKKLKNKITIYVIVMFTTITTMALLQRFLLMMMIICCFVLLYYVSNKIRFKNILLFSSIVIVAFFFVSLMRSNGAITLYGYIMSRMDFPVRYALFTDPYMYVAMNVENFAHAAEVHSEYSFGFYTFDSVFAVTGLKHWMTDYFMTDATPYLITGTYNTYTAFWTFYRDFGLYGLFLIPFIAGCAVQYVYSALYRSPSIMRLVLYCLSIFLIALSFFVNYTGFLWFDIDVLMGIIVSHVATVRSRDIKLARS